MSRRYPYTGLLVSLLLLTGCAHMAQDRINDQAAARVNARLGFDFFAEHRYRQAREKFTRALAYNEDSLLANWGMALLYQVMDEPQKAQAHYRRIVDQPHVDPEILNSYGAFLCAQGDVDSAMQYFEQAATSRLNRLPATALANAGLCRQRADDVQAAERYYRKALAVNPAQAVALVHMAEIQYRRGNHLGARAFVERADAANALTPKLLLLAARNEQALGDDDTARQYLQRYNRLQTGTPRTVEQLRQDN